MGGTYKLKLEFSEDYPSKPPKVSFDPVIFHPNVYREFGPHPCVLHAVRHPRVLHAAHIPLPSSISPPRHPLRFFSLTPPPPHPHTSLTTQCSPAASGTVCLNILNEEKAWKPSITVKMILQGVQDLLDNANLGDPAQREPFHLARDHPEQYRLRVIQEARKHAT